jgi:Na+/H+ antiporter NhaA
VDDIGAILVIALFYAGGVSLGFLAAAAALCGLMLLLQRAGVRATSAFVGLGALVWLATYESGVHPAIAGVVLGLLAPAESYQRPRVVSAEAKRTADQTMDHPKPPDADAGQWLRLAALSREAVSPLARTEHALLPWTSFVIIPLFALANAGVRLSGEQVSAASTSRVTLGVVLGLVIGKVVGVSGAAALAVALRLARFPAGVRPAHLIGASAVAGIGFTVSLFMAELAFEDEPLIAEAKVGILAASVLAGALGWIVLRLSPSAEDASIGDVGDGGTNDRSGH